MKSKIWRLEELASQYLSLIPHDLQYFGQHFVGVYLPDNWTPPSITINGKSKKLADIISWMIQSPVISEKMKNILQDLCGDSVQFLRFHDLKNKPYYAMNVLAVVPDIVDLELSELKYVVGSTPPKPYDVTRCIFSSKIDSIEIPPIFKISLGGRVLSDIFVSKPFVDMAIAEKFTGFALMNPSRNSFQALLNGENPNDIEGIIG